ncbi:MAG: Lactyl (2) diphospho-(5')guanosine:7,8-didemethyl-8-hydroxy-5-deazariboflavin 2-phospho-L-lactate transferase [uncultured Solirubrobacterales bacterium]|uniref:Lactyl (2) diphospho-(5')guanosine:7,8-didemethyl-8-hydroxy-5-deazarib oflavin 2-phospho-L-lactate transferase n=1 Tax=uncultured Solirubrobacterales bacterium TaxID=768556 RepID=A0A6J4S1S8_9ACTN|nr:MAG: Lactyl (2) diphospho-(5')guanosine:7,8-didemethyl-8-hydroxy-5-deazariboflavin 2-phospho-L-lactate transferase [uncultured Solirubrobacterales bacterium]
MVAVLAGGTGGAKLARGMLDVVGGEELAVIANTADDIEVYGAHVSPDPDLIAYALADVLDERGYGIAGDTWAVMDALAAAGRETWFRLGDRDLALCLLRTELMHDGARLTEAHAQVVAGLGLRARVLPMADEPVRTQVRANGRVRPFQEFMILEEAKGPVEGVELCGVEAARPTPEVLDAVAAAEAIVVGPSNPVISIGPILAVPEMRDALIDARAPVVALSPFVGGRAVKGPTEAFCAQAGIAPSAQGIAEAYAGVIDGLVADEPVAGTSALGLDTLMDSPGTRERVAAATLDFARSLAPR